MRVVIARNFENNVWTLDGMLTEIQAKELSLSVTASNDDKSANRNHVSSKCLKITEPASPKKILRQKGLCFICFSKEHLASSCKLHYICRKCNGKHHISICAFEPSKSNVINPPSQEDSVEATATNFSSNKNTVLLQTALATTTNIFGKLHSETLVLFDSRSQRTYISTELREKLKLLAVTQERILIKTFGKLDFSAQAVDIVVIKIKKGNTERFVEAICMSVICSELLKQNIPFASQNYAHLNGLELADCSKNSVKKVDMLVGLDYYYKFIAGEY